MKFNFLQTRILSVFNLLKRVGFALLLLGFSIDAKADWSPEIILWQNPEGIAGAGLDVGMNVDTFEHVHIAFTFPYRHRSTPNLERVGISYVQYDDIGNQLVPVTFLSESLDTDAGYPLIRFFGQDSLWVMWVGGRDSDPSSYSLKYVSLNLAGQILHPVRDFERIHRPAGDDFVFEVLDDRSVVIVDGENRLGCLYMTVQRPDGERVMNDAVIWDSTACWDPHGYIDHTDSLQLIWRQSLSGNWITVFGRRMDPLTPFDTLTIENHDVLAPFSSHSPQAVRPIGDSLIALLVSSPGIPIRTRLSLLDRDSYEERNQIILGSLASQINVAVENGSELGTVVGDTVIRALFYRRYRLSDLSLVENTLLAEAESIYHGLVGAEFTVSRSGIRYAAYARFRSGSSAGNVKIVYRVYSPLISAETIEPLPTAFSLSAFPNPFNSTLSISLEIPLHQEVTISLYDLLGREVDVIQRGRLESSTLSYSVPPSLASGIYFVRAVTARDAVMQKVVLLK